MKWVLKGARRGQRRMLAPAWLPGSPLAQAVRSGIAASWTESQVQEPDKAMVGTCQQGHVTCHRGGDVECLGHSGQGSDIADGV